MIRIIDMTDAVNGGDAEPDDEFELAIWNTVNGKFMTGPESDTLTWTVADWHGPIWCAFDPPFRSRVRNLLPTKKICLGCDRHVELNRKGEEEDFCSDHGGMAGVTCNRCDKWSPGPSCFYRCSKEASS